MASRTSLLVNSRQRPSSLRFDSLPLPPQGTLLDPSLHRARSRSSLRFDTPPRPRLNSSDSSVAFPSGSTLVDPDPNTPSTPRNPSKSNHSRRMTYGGDPISITREVALDYEEKIILLEARNSRMSVELEAYRDALNDEREERSIERHSAILTSPPPSSTPDAHINEHSDVVYERKLRMEILESLKKIRGQNSLLSRQLSEYKEKCSSLIGTLDSERQEKSQLESEFKRISQLNFTLLEHNKLLVGRDAALQEEISTLITKSQAEDWMRSVLEEELRNLRQGSQVSHTQNADSGQGHDGIPLDHDSIKRRSLAITLEHTGPLRAQLTTARDELHLTNLRLAESEQRCNELMDKITSLQHNMSLCVDSSARALEVERELRSEVTNHATAISEENMSLKSTVEKMQQQQLAELTSARAAEKRQPKLSKRKSIEKRYTQRPQRLVISRTKESPPTLAAALSLPQPSPSRTSSLDLPKTPDTLVALPPEGTRPKVAILDQFFRPFHHSTPSRSTSIDSNTSATVHSPLSMLPSSAKSTPLLTATLGRKTYKLQNTLKTDSTIYVDVVTSVNDTIESFCTVDGKVGKRSSRTKKRRSGHMRRASLLLNGIAQTFAIRAEDDFVFV